MAGPTAPEGTCWIYDDDHYYMGGLMGRTMWWRNGRGDAGDTGFEVSNWARNTLEQHKIQARLLNLGVRIETNQAVARIERGGVSTACVFTGRREPAAETVLLVTARLPQEALYRSLADRRGDWAPPGWPRSPPPSAMPGPPRPSPPPSMPGGALCRGLEEPCPDAMPFRREVTRLPRHNLGSQGFTPRGPHAL
jgi:dimethylamine/trimethylamine dehydrogenase